jgi:hypothetical protein
VPPVPDEADAAVSVDEGAPEQHGTIRGHHLHNSVATRWIGKGGGEPSRWRLETGGDYAVFGLGYLEVGDDFGFASCVSADDRVIAGETERVEPARTAR